MSVNELRFYPRLPAVTKASQSVQGTDPPTLEPATCTEAEPFALRVLDDSMQPEFRCGCIILIDPTGRATDGSYVLADDGTQAEDATEGLVFRQLHRGENGEWVLRALNERYAEIPAAEDLSNVMGVIVQRAGVRRRYHKHYV